MKVNGGNTYENKESVGCDTRIYDDFFDDTGNCLAAEELSEEVVIEDEAVSDLEEPETDIEEIQDESDDTEAEVDAFSDEETTEKQLENNEALESASLFSDTEEDTIAVGISGKIVANGTDPWNKDVTWTLYDDGELVFDGSGTMEDYTESKLPAWYQYREKSNQCGSE